MHRRVTFIVSVGLGVLLAGAWVVRVQSVAHDHRLIKFGYLGGTDDPRHIAAVRFKELVEFESKGALRVELYYGGQLGGDRDVIEGVSLGTVEMTAAGVGVFAPFEPALGVSALPFLFDSFEEVWAFNDSPLNARIGDRLLQRDLRVLGYWDNGFRCITNSVRPINAPSDLRGLNIRTPENPVLLATFDALGASPSPLPWPELYMALQQGAFDGQENPLPTIYANKLYEVQEYLSITNHAYDGIPVVINEVFWKGLSEAHRTVIRRALDESRKLNRRLVSERTIENETDLARAGLRVSRPNRRAFRDATAGVRRQVSAQIGPAVVDEVLAFVAAYRVAGRTHDDDSSGG